MLYLYVPEDPARWIAAFKAADPTLTIVTAADAPDPAAITWVAAWSPPPGLLGQFPNLKGVFALGAGVDRLLNRDDLPASIPVVRLLDAGMGRQMVDYVLFAALWFQRDMDRYSRQQNTIEWREHMARSAQDLRIGILGLGTLGTAVGRGLAAHGYPVAGWRRTAQAVEGLETFSGADGLDTLLAQSDLLVNLLPATPETAGILNEERLAKLPTGAAVVNIGRGPHLDTTALRRHLDSGHLRGAVLDVFTTEPLPADDSLWRHPAVLVTPHIAAATLPGPAAKQIIASIAALRGGQTPDGLVARQRGY